MSNKPLRYN